MGGVAMDPQSFLTPDHRWTIWKCNTHQEYLDRFLIKGKFHSEVPEDIKIAYETVERLIAYSYFHYPLTEEVMSKLSRIFEMAVKNRAKALGLSFDSLSNCIKVLSSNPDIDPELSFEWNEFKRLRNFYAHPESNSFFGPIVYRSVYLMVNILNRIFCSKAFLSSLRIKLEDLQKRTEYLNEGVFIFETLEKKYLLTGARPIMITPDEKISFWNLSPAVVKFPQNMEEYYILNPLFVRLTNILESKDSFSGYDIVSQSSIRIIRTAHEQNLSAYNSFKKQNESAEPDVIAFHEHYTYSEVFHERERFIYDEFWEPTNRSD